MGLAVQVPPALSEALGSVGGITILNDMHRDIRLVSWDVDGTLFSFFDLALALSKNAPGRLWTCGWADTLEGPGGRSQLPPCGGVRAAPRP